MSAARIPVPLLSELATEVGLELRGVTAVEPLPDQVLQRLQNWFDQGRAGEMDYLPRAAEVLGNPADWKAWAKSIVLFALPYHRAPGAFRGGGRVATYALGRDYHNLLGKRLERLGKRLRERGLVEHFRGCTDAAPLLEREWALRGELGWRGKNTLLIDPQHGPWVILGELLLDCALPEYQIPPTRQASCGTCTRCLDVCPTGALDQAYQLDARLCISYLTIELRGPIPIELRSKIGDWVFGCDLCLEVCPFGHHTDDYTEQWGSHPALGQYCLIELLEISAADFELAFRGSPIRRTGWAGLLRNVCVVLGNLGARNAADVADAVKVASALEHCLATHPETLVRGHAAWALGQLGCETELLACSTHQSDAWVRTEVEQALLHCQA
jgi:epoxyqueuosine reductase